MATNYIPPNYHTVTPYLTSRHSAQVIAFLKSTFDAQEMFRMNRPDGTVGHAEMRVGDSMVMLGDVMDGQPPMTAMLYVYVKDVDATFKRAVQAGGTVVREPATQFYGDRHGAVTDPAGNAWWIATHVEDVSPEELQKRAAAAQH